MRLDITVPASIDPDPLSEAALNAADTAASQQAVTWTQPVYTGSDQNGYHYTTDAIPRTAMVTTANIAPALLPPKV